MCKPLKYTPLSVYVRDAFRISTWSLSGSLFSSAQLMAFAVLLLAVIKQRCIAAGAAFWIEGELPVFIVRPHAPNRDARTVTVRYESEHVSEAERRDTPLNIPLCGRALRSVAHGQSKHSANIPLTLTGKPNPAQITLWHNISLVGLIVCFFPVYNEIRTSYVSGWRSACTF